MSAFALQNLPDLPPLRIYNYTYLALPCLNTAIHIITILCNVLHQAELI